MTATVYQVHGMTCEHCVRAVESEVGEVPGVDAVEVDLDTGRTVITGEDVDDAAVRAAVNEAGYRADLLGAPGGPDSR